MFASLKRTAVLAGILAAVLAAPAAADKYSRGEKKEIDWDPGKRIVVEEVAGGIEVRGVKSDKVVIEGLLTVEAGSLKAARVENRNLTMEVTSGRDEIRIVARRPRDWRGVRGWIDYNIKAPLGAVLVLKTVSGDLRVIGVDGAVHANSVSGDVLIRGASGAVEARSVSGSVQLKNCPGDVVAETVGGAVGYDAAKVDGKSITLRSTGGDVRAALPRDLSARVQAVTLSGKIRSDLPLKVSREDKKALKGTLGGTGTGGAADVRINTVSGSIILTVSGGAGEK